MSPTTLKTTLKKSPSPSTTTIDLEPLLSSTNSTHSITAFNPFPKKNLTKHFNLTNAKKGVAKVKRCASKALEIACRVVGVRHVNRYAVIINEDRGYTNPIYVPKKIADNLINAQTQENKQKLRKILGVEYEIELERDEGEMWYSKAIFTKGVQFQARRPRDVDDIGTRIESGEFHETRQNAQRDEACHPILYDNPGKGIDLLFSNEEDDGDDSSSDDKDGESDDFNTHFDTDSDSDGSTVQSSIFSRSPSISSATSTVPSTISSNSSYDDNDNINSGNWSLASDDIDSLFDAGEALRMWDKAGRDAISDFGEDFDEDFDRGDDEEWEDEEGGDGEKDDEEEEREGEEDEEEVEAVEYEGKEEKDEDEFEGEYEDEDDRLIWHLALVWFSMGQVKRL